MPGFDRARAGQVVEAVIWPAAAGNVAWSLLSLLLQGKATPEWWWGQAPSIAYLVFLSVYLFLACYRGLPSTSGAAEPPRFRGVIFDVFLATTVALLAISIPNGDLAYWGAAPPDQWLVIWVFGIAFAGHASRSWVRATDAAGKRKEENISAALAIFYVLVIAAFYVCARLGARRGTVLTFAVTIIFWILLRGGYLAFPLSLVEKARTARSRWWQNLSAPKPDTPPKASTDGVSGRTTTVEPAAPAGQDTPPLPN